MLYFPISTADAEYQRKERKKMKAALVLMAAGLGSRYGGNKQVDGVGPCGEILMEYAVHDAIRAGFTKIVFIIKSDIADLVDRLCGDYLKKAKTREGEPLEVCYVMQGYDSIPTFYQIPEARTKPFGTTHAVLCAKDVICEPFCVINADDYYGADAYRTMYEALQQMPPEGSAAMVGYLLKNTVSENGTVTRGVCKAENGNLTAIKETMKIRLFPDGTIADTSGDTPVFLDGDTVVSMNMWGFQPSIFREMEAYFHQFLHDLKENDLKGECLLPTMVGDMIREELLQVEVLHSADRWFGMTYHEDRAAVAEELRKLHERGFYPPTLKL